MILRSAGGLLSTPATQLCLTDSGDSKTNRTQRIVYPCHNTSNQNWTQLTACSTDPDRGL